MAEMTIEQRETARKAHADSYVRIKVALESGFYLEAIVMEYAALESRMNVIMGILNKPCALCGDTNITHSIGLLRKARCLRQFVSDNPKLFSPKLTKNQVQKLCSFCSARDQRIHGLLENPERYQEFMKGNATLAQRGYDILKLLSSETQRLRRIKKNHPERLENASFSCLFADDENCGNAIKSVSEKK